MLEAVRVVLMTADPPMKKHELDLLGNSIDSLNEALAKYQQAQNDEHLAYKFAILHFAHFAELLFKHCVAQAHPLLIYRDPFKRDLRGAKTIGLWEAVAFLENDGKAITPEFRKDLEWMKELRNDIEHYRFTMDLDEVKETLGRLMSAVADFNQVNSFVDLEKLVDEEVLEVFQDLADTYSARLRAALQKVDKAREEAYRGVRPKEWDLVSWNVYSCDECGHDTMIRDDNSDSGYRCAFCDSTDSGTIEVGCGLCGESWPKDEMWYTDWAGDGQFEHICPRCRRDPEYVKDD